MEILLFGATGLVGKHCLELLLLNSQVTQVTLPTRRPIPQPEDPSVLPKFNPVIVSDFTHPDAAKAVRPSPGPTHHPTRGMQPPRAAILCLGTTLRRAGSPQAFHDQDFGAVVGAARIAHALGAPRLVLVSSVGADAKSSNLYLRTKGEVEQAVAKLGFGSVEIFRPSLLLGEREESRPAEAFAQKLAPLSAPLMIGPLAKYRPVEARELAQALIHTALAPEPRSGNVAAAPVIVVEGREIKKRARSGD